MSLPWQILNGHFLWPLLNGHMTELLDTTKYLLRFLAVGFCHHRHVSNVNTRHPGLFNPLLVFVTLRYSRHYPHYAANIFVTGISASTPGHSHSAQTVRSYLFAYPVWILSWAFLFIFWVLTMFCCGGELNSDKWFDGARVPWARTDVQCPAVVAVTSPDVSRPTPG